MVTYKELGPVSMPMPYDGYNSEQILMEGIIFWRTNSVSDYSYAKTRLEILSEGESLFQEEYNDLKRIFNSNKYAKLYIKARLVQILEESDAIGSRSLGPEEEDDGEKDVQYNLDDAVRDLLEEYEIPEEVRGKIGKQTPLGGNTGTDNDDKLG